MSLLRHVIFALIYGVLAIAVALTLPYSVPGMERWTAVAIGALILIFGAVLHEVWSRQERERALQVELGDLARARDAVLGELARAREEVRAIRGALLETPKTTSSLDEMKAEVQMLQRLVAEISARPATSGPPKDAASPGGAPAVRHLNPHALDEGQVLQLVRRAIRYDRIDMSLQPIVSLPQRKLRHYQAFSRIRTDDGAYLLPHQAGDLVGQAGLAAPLDNVLLFRSVQLVRETLRRHRSLGCFAHVSTRSLADPAFMRQFVEFMADNPELAPRLVFALSMADLVRAPEPLRRELDRLADVGFRFCIDGIDHLHALDLDLIEQAHVRFLKIDARTLLQAVDGDDPIDPKRFKQALDRAAIDLIVDGIDDEALLIELLDLPIDYGQGVLFGEPRT